MHLGQSFDFLALFQVVGHSFAALCWGWTGGIGKLDGDVMFLSSFYSDLFLYLLLFLWIDWRMGWCFVMLEKEGLREGEGCLKFCFLEGMGNDIYQAPWFIFNSVFIFISFLLQNLASSRFGFSRSWSRLSLWFLWGCGVNEKKKGKISIHMMLLGMWCSFSLFSGNLLRDCGRAGLLCY